MVRGRKQKANSTAAVTTNKSLVTTTEEINGIDFPTTINEECDTGVSKNINKKKRKQTENDPLDVEATNSKQNSNTKIFTNKRRKEEKKEKKKKEKVKKIDENDIQGEKDINNSEDATRGVDISTAEKNVVLEQNHVEQVNKEEKKINEKPKKSKKSTVKKVRKSVKDITAENETLKKQTNQSIEIQGNEIQKKSETAIENSTTDELKKPSKELPKQGSITNHIMGCEDKKIKNKKNENKKNKTHISLHSTNGETALKDDNLIGDTPKASKEKFETIKPEADDAATTGVTEKGDEVMEREYIQTENKRENKNVQLNTIRQIETDLIKDSVKEKTKDTKKCHMEDGLRKQTELETSEKEYYKNNEAVVQNETNKQISEPHEMEKLKMDKENIDESRIESEINPTEMKQTEKENFENQNVLGVYEIRNMETSHTETKELEGQTTVKESFQKEDIANEDEIREEEDILTTYLLKETKKDTKQILSELRNTLFNMENTKTEGNERSENERSENEKNENEESENEESENKESENKESENEESENDEKENEEKENEEKKYVVEENKVIEECKVKDYKFDDSGRKEVKEEKQENEQDIIVGITTEEMNVLNRWFSSNKLKILDCFFQNMKLGSHLLEPLYTVYPNFKFNKSKVIRYLRHMKQKYEKNIKQNEKTELEKKQKSHCYDTILNMLNGDENNLKEKIYMTRYITFLKNESNLLHLQFFIEYLLEKGDTYTLELFIDSGGLLCFKVILQKMASKSVMKSYPSLLLDIMNILKKCDISLEDLKNTLIGIPINFIAKNKNDEQKGLDFRTGNPTVIKCATMLVAHWKEIRDKTIKGELPLKKNTKRDISKNSYSNCSEKSGSAVEYASDKCSSNSTVLAKSNKEDLQNADMKQKNILLMEAKNKKSCKSEIEQKDNNIMLSLLGSINQEHEKKKMRHLEYKKAKLEGKFKKHTAIKNSIESNKKKEVEIDIDREELMKLQKGKEVIEQTAIPMKRNSIADSFHYTISQRNDVDLTENRNVSVDKTSFYSMNKPENTVEYTPLYKTDRKMEYNRRLTSFNRSIANDNYHKNYGSNVTATAPGIYKTINGKKMDSKNGYRRAHTFYSKTDYAQEKKKEHYHEPIHKNYDYIQESNKSTEYIPKKYNSGGYKSRWDKPVINADNNFSQGKAEMRMVPPIESKTNTQKDVTKFANVQPLPRSLFPLQELFPLPPLPPLSLPESVPNSPVGPFATPSLSKKDVDQELRQGNFEKDNIYLHCTTYKSNEDHLSFGKDKNSSEDPFRHCPVDFYEEDKTQNYQEKNYSKEIKHNTMNNKNSNINNNNNNHNINNINDSNTNITINDYIINNNNYSKDSSYSHSLYKNNVNEYLQKANVNTFEEEKVTYLHKNKWMEKEFTNNMIPRETNISIDVTNTNKPYANINQKRPHSSMHETSETAEKGNIREFNMLNNMEIQTSKNIPATENMNLLYPRQIVTEGEITKMDKIITLALGEYNEGSFVINTEDAFDKTFVVLNNHKMQKTQEMEKEKQPNISFTAITTTLNTHTDNSTERGNMHTQIKRNHDGKWDINKTEHDKENLIGELPHPPLSKNVDTFEASHLRWENNVFAPYEPPLKEQLNENIIINNNDHLRQGFHNSVDAHKFASNDSELSFTGRHSYEEVDQFVNMFDEDFQQVLRKNVDLSHLLMSKPEIVAQMLRGPKYITEALNSLTEELKNLKELK